MAASNRRGRAAAAGSEGGPSRACPAMTQMRRLRAVNEISVGYQWFGYWQSMLSAVSSNRILTSARDWHAISGGSRWIRAIEVTCDWDMGRRRGGNPCNLASPSFVRIGAVP